MISVQTFRRTDLPLFLAALWSESAPSPSAGAASPDDTAAKLALRQALESLRAGQFDVAIARLQNVPKSSSLQADVDAEALCWLGEAYARAGRTDEAQKMFKTLTGKHPRSLWAKFARGRLAESGR